MLIKNFSLLTGLLFSSLDTSIVSTSLVTISHDLNDFTNAPWIVLAYLLTYMGMSSQTLWTKQTTFNIMLQDSPFVYPS